LSQSNNPIFNLPICPTPLATPINPHPQFPHKLTHYISQNTHYPFLSSQNKFHPLTPHHEVLQLHPTFNPLPRDLMKIPNDVRSLASRPR
ncbi:lyase family protein, partial [Staphylococcus aureus]|uniref:lyase family protein n=1 Tax=Staphylococcus aureus TaxID=1280 RepID=UPI0021B3994B